MCHNIYASDEDVFMFAPVKSCGVAVRKPKSASTRYKIWGITVQHDSSVRCAKGWKWPVLRQGIARIQTLEPVNAGDLAWVCGDTGFLYSSDGENRFPCNNIRFITGGMNPVITISQDETEDLPVPEYYYNLSALPSGGSVTRVSGATLWDEDCEPEYYPPNTPRFLGGKLYLEKESWNQITRSEPASFVSDICNFEAAKGGVLCTLKVDVSAEGLLGSLPLNMQVGSSRDVFWFISDCKNLKIDFLYEGSLLPVEGNWRVNPLKSKYQYSFAGDMQEFDSIQISTKASMKAGESFELKYFQKELGDVPTSYIATSGSSATRYGDYLSMNIHLKPYEPFSILFTSQDLYRENLQHNEGSVKTLISTNSFRDFRIGVINLLGGDGEEMIQVETLYEYDGWNPFAPQAKNPWDSKVYCVVYDGDEIITYLDGEEYDRIAPPKNLEDMDGKNMFLGGYYSGKDRVSPSVNMRTFSDFYFWREVLTPDEVKHFSNIKYGKGG